MDNKNFKVTENIKISECKSSIMTEQEDEEIKDTLLEDVKILDGLHKKLMAEEKWGVLVILQALDAAGKDEMITHVFSKLTPQGFKDTSYGKPTDEEKNHGYLWRFHKAMPERGQIGILNRSYYEDIITPKVYDILKESPLPDKIIEGNIWEERYEQINSFEKYLTQNGFPVIKFFFNMSRDTQKERLLERLENKTKQHEFSFSDIEDRKNWIKYQSAFEEMVNNTSTEYAPWYVLPADNPWASRKIVVKVMIDVLKGIDPHYPTFKEDELRKVEDIITQLKNNDI